MKSKFVKEPYTSLKLVWTIGWDLTESTESTESTNLTDSTDLTKSTNLTDSTDLTDSTSLTGSTNSTDSTESPGIDRIAPNWLNRQDWIARTESPGPNRPDRIADLISEMNSWPNFKSFRPKLSQNRIKIGEVSKFLVFLAKN